VKVPGFFTRNIKLKATAASMTLITWATVVYAGNPPESRTVSVKVPQDQESLPSKFVLTHPIPDISVRVSGTRDHVNAFDPKSLVVTVDYKAIKDPGHLQLPLSIVNNDHNVDLVDQPTTVTVDLDLLSTATVAVNIVVKSPPPTDYVIQSKASDPDRVTVIGPQRELDGIQAVVTVDLSNKKDLYTRDLNVEIRDKVGHPLSDVGVDPLTVRIQVVIVPQKATRAVAIKPTLNGSPVGLLSMSYDPGTVVLFGPEDVLNSLDSVPTTAIDVRGFVGDRVFNATLQLPAGVVPADGKAVTVTVRLSVAPPPTPTPAPTPVPTPPPSPTPTKSP
jgi:YbbR domain-containing protein